METFQCILQMGTAASLRSADSPSPAGKVNSLRKMFSIHDTPSCILINSARKGDDDKLERVLQDGIDPNQAESVTSRMTALHYAARHGHADCVGLLLSYGAAVDVQESKGWQPVHEAAQHGRRNCLHILLDQGAPVDALTYTLNGRATPIHYAARHGHLDCVQLLIQRGADCSMDNEHGETALHFTAMRGHPACMECILNTGVDANASTINGSTAAYFSAVCGHVTCLEVLLENTDVKLDKPYKDGRTLLHHSTETNKLDFMETLLKHGASTEVYTIARKLTPLHVAVRNGYEVGVALLLKHGAKLEARSSQDLTPLHHAVRCGHYEVVSFLLNQGAQVNAVSEEKQQTVVHMSVTVNDKRMARIVLCAGADPCTADCNGKTPTQLAHDDEMRRILGKTGK